MPAVVVVACLLIERPARRSCAILSNLVVDTKETQGAVYVHVHCRRFVLFARAISLRIFHIFFFISLLSSAPELPEPVPWPRGRLR